jgi:pyruvate,orthophosphate dikinase
MYGDVVIGVQKRANEDHEPFETVIHEFKHKKYHKDIVDSEAHRRRPAGTGEAFKALVKERTGKVFRTIRGSSCAARRARCSVPG